MSQISTRWTTPYDRAQLARPIRTRLPPTQLLDVVHMHQRACMVPPKCLQSPLYTKPPTRSQRVAMGVQALLSKVVVITTGGILCRCCPAQATRPCPQRRPDNCVFTVAGQSVQQRVLTTRRASLEAPGTVRQCSFQHVSCRNISLSAIRKPLDVRQHRG